SITVECWLRLVPQWLRPPGTQPAPQLRRAGLATPCSCPTTAVVDAEAELDARPGGWGTLLVTAGDGACPRLSQPRSRRAPGPGGWPGSLSGRHAVHEAHALRCVVATRDPGAYTGLRVSLLVV